jgi:peroxiredoxin
MNLHAMVDPGVALGGRAPEFRARDQFGREQSLKTLSGPDGLVLLFFRSADW